MGLLTGRDQARPVGVCVGPAGRVFVTVAYMAHNEGSPTYRSDLVMIARAGDRTLPTRGSYEAAAAGRQKLWAELADPSWSRREAAHVELLRRGPDAAREAVTRLQGPPFR